MKKQKSRKPGRHHWFLISVFVIILLLAVVAFVLQRSTNIEAVAGEAIRQRIQDTKQLALTEEQVKISQAVQKGEETIFIECPRELLPATEQHWGLKEGWKFKPLENVEATCSNNRIYCYYANSLDRTDQIITYLDVSGAKSCSFSLGGGFKTVGCSCTIA